LPEIPATGLTAPDKRLKNVSFEHFSLFDTFFFDYVNGRKEESQALFTASLYLQKGETVTAIDFAERVNFIAKNVDKSTQYTIFLNCTFIRKWLSKPFPYLFGFTEEDPDESKKKIRTGKPNRPDWNGILDALAGDDVLHYEQYKQISCLVAFRTVNNRIKNYSKYGK
jgi:hypothetical protein